MSEAMPFGYVGAFGRYAVVRIVDGQPRVRETVLWNLATKAKRSIVLPDDRECFAYPGMTQNHLWLLSTRISDMKTRYLMRFLLQE